MDLPKLLCRPFSDVFTITSTEIGIEIIAKIDIQMGEESYTSQKAILGNSDLLKYRDKYFVGYWLPFPEVFQIRGVFEEPPIWII